MCCVLDGDKRCGGKKKKKNQARKMRNVPETEGTVMIMGRKVSRGEVEGTAIREPRQE